MKQLVFALLFFPLLAFGVAAFTEARSNLSTRGRIGRLIPIACGIGAFLFSFKSSDILDLTPSGSVVLSRIMMIVSIAIACSGAVARYSRRSSTILVAAGGLVLTFIWWFNVIIT